MIRLITATASIALLAACTTTEPADPSAEEKASTEATIIDYEPSQFELAMNTVDELMIAGNSQAAIDRLTQLLGNPDLSPEDKAAALLRRGEIRYGENGYDVWGAISDFDEATSPDGYLAEAAQPLLDMARGEATSINFALETQPLSRMERFVHLFRLGQHTDAIDLMQASDLSPDNAHLLDFLTNRLYAVDGVRETETFMYLQIVKEVYSWPDKEQEVRSRK